jgi:hypothetical protein
MEMKVGVLIGLVFFIVLAVSLVPTVFEVLNGTDTSDWASFTGGSGAVAIFELLLLLFVAAIAIIIVKFAIE